MHIPYAHACARLNLRLPAAAPAAGA
eukprot:SAG22_NODE_9382_length_592_cov_1.190669_2_plen_25_part_01